MLMNYIALETDTPTRLHFTDYYYVERLIWDPELKIRKMVRSLVFWVDRLDGEPCARTFSVLSKKLAAQLEGYLAEDKFKEYEFIITKSGEGFLTEYRVKVIPYVP